MKTTGWAISTVLFLAILQASVSRAEDVGLISGDRVNVRGQPTIYSEVVARLGKGHPVVLLEEIVLSKPREGDPTNWFRIRLPETAQVWVHADFVDLEAQTVSATRLNLRAGPGENHSILGRLDRGKPITVVRSVDSWIEIKPPADAYAFVAGDLVMRESRKPLPPPEPIAASPPADPPITTQDILDDAPILHDPPVTAPQMDPVVVLPPPALAFPDEPPAAIEVDPAPPPAAVGPVPKRIVKREGIVRRSISPRAPSLFTLEDIETGRMINYLHTEDRNIPLRNFSGHRIVVTGEEAVDPRWPRVPLLTIETIQLP